MGERRQYKSSPLQRTPRVLQRTPHAVGLSGSHMPTDSLDRQLSDLEQLRYRFAPGDADRVLRLLNSLDAARFPDTRSLIRFHEALLFLRAFPQAHSIIRVTERILDHFHLKVKVLRESGADMSAFDLLEVSGIAGTEMSDTLSFDLARWLVRRLPGKVMIDWDEWDGGRSMATILPRFLPLLEDDAFVEADTPWRRWLETAHGKKSTSPQWLIERFEQSSLSDREKAEFYDSLRVPLRWDLGNSRLSRTRNWKAVRKFFCHSGPLISRSEVSLAHELAKRPPKLTKLPRKQGEAVIDAIREVMLVRYRELYGTTLGDPASVVRAEIGRGASIYLWNLPPERRLPLRAYVAGFTWKNGVPINYIEAIGLCEWMEVGFNTFYTFRGGEAGWMYAQVLRCLCHLMGTTCISVYPYQLGHDNEEAIESGAFWFYRKLGLRPGRADLLKLVEREERKIAASRARTSRILTTEDTLRLRSGQAAGYGGIQERTSEYRTPARGAGIPFGSAQGIPARQPYRTPARILKRLAAGHVFYELPGCEMGAWDRFSTRNIGLRVNQRMAREFRGDSRRLREASSRSVARILGVNASSWTAQERASFENFAVVLDLIPDLSSWTPDEKQALVQIIRAKPKPDEMLYLHLTQRHEHLRQALLRLGS